MMRIGYIGLGLMGQSMARNILKAGYPVTVHNRSRVVVAKLTAEGAEEAFSPAEVAAKSDVVFTNLPDSGDVMEVVLGENGILEGVRPGMIYIDNSTIKTAYCQSDCGKAQNGWCGCVGCPGQRRGYWRARCYADDYGWRLC